MWSIHEADQQTLGLRIEDVLHFEYQSVSCSAAIHVDTCGSIKTAFGIECAVGTVSHAESLELCILYTLFKIKT